MFGRESHSLGGLRSRMAGSNNELLVDTNTIYLLLFDLERLILWFMFQVYSILHHLCYCVTRHVHFFSSHFWALVMVANITEIEPSTPTSASSSLTESITYWPLQFYNYAIRSAATSRVPTSKETVTSAIKIAPATIGVIFDMFPLVVRPPQEVPTPYLNAEKKMIVPEKRQVSRILRQQAEWSAAQHTHKVSEILRVCSEAARITAWSACIGVRTLILHEGNGYAWRSMDNFISMVQAELASIQVTSASIQFIHLTTNETVVLNNDPATLTVYLTSEMPKVNYNAIGEKVLAMLELPLTQINDIDSFEIPAPNLLIRYTSERRSPGALDGFLMNPDKLVTFDTRPEPVTFGNFARAVNQCATQITSAF